MSKYTLYHNNRNSLCTIEDVVWTFEWLKKCFEHVFHDVNNLDIVTRITFSAGQIDYECSSIEEFKEMSFGQNIEPGDLFLMAKDGTASIHSLASFWTRNNGPEDKNEITLSTDEKKYLVVLKETLDMEPNCIPVHYRNENIIEPKTHDDESKIGVLIEHEKVIATGIESVNDKPPFFFKTILAIVDTNHCWRSYSNYCLNI